MAGSSHHHPLFRWSGEDLLLSVIVQPRASNNAIIGVHGDQLKVRLTAAPIEGKANQALIDLLGKTFAVPQSRVYVEKGHNSRIKLVRIKQPKTLPDFIKNKNNQ